MSALGQFSKILVANRGEIACRVFRTAKRLGIKTVAVFSDADRHSMHVAAADEAVHIGPAPVAESYLRGDRILEVAAATGAQAIHPGYGFLSENEIFATACEDANVKFIGPPASAIRDMGSKSASKNIMEAAGVPCTPGYHGDAQDLDTLRAEADRIGYPIMIKAVLGGGGKGMRIVRDAASLEGELERARSEAMKFFADDRVLLERYLPKPRHVEFQVFADDHGNCVHLFERDCSVQRRHQKVLEEAPAPLMTPELRARMGQSSVDAARAVGYRGAGTVEFMVDEDNETYFFMEMNTRLQVEHPVTEMITGVDLVEWQLRVAAGHPLPLQQEDLSINGHAIEARVYAENPYNDFLPGTGKLVHVKKPDEDNGMVRTDTGVDTGDEVSIFYDPMIAKLIVWAPDRTAALHKLAASLHQYQVVGLPTNIEFAAATATHPAFIEGGVDTSFLEPHNYGEELMTAPPPPPPSASALAAVACVLRGFADAAAASTDVAPTPWTLPATESARLFGAGSTAYRFKGLGPVTVRSARDGETRTVQFEGEDGEAVEVLGAALDGQRLTARIGDTVHSCDVVFTADAVTLFGLGSSYKYDFELDFVSADAAAGDGDKPIVVTPMPGRVIKVLASVGDSVKQGDQVLVLEAMKMEHSIEAPCDGVVEDIVEFDQMVNDGNILLSLGTGSDE